MANDPISTALKEESDPFKLPRGVRATPTMHGVLSGKSANEVILEDGDLLPPHAQILKNLVFCYALAERRRVGTKKSSVDEKRKGERGKRRRRRREDDK